MRLFIALELPKPVKDGLFGFGRELAGLLPQGRYVPRDNFHVTLRFIGESSRIGELTLAMEQGVRGVRPFSLHLGDYGNFGKGQARTGILGIQGDLTELHVLHQSLDAALETYGFGREPRPLVPHITMARNLPPHEELFDQINTLRPQASFYAHHLTLYESLRDKEGQMVYRPLQRQRFHEV